MTRITRSFLILCLAGLLVTAGCVAGPFGGQDRPVKIVLNNSANTIQTFEVSVVELPATVRTKFGDNRTADNSIGEGVGQIRPPENSTYRAVKLPDSARLHGRYTLEPGEQNQSSITDLPRDFAVIVVVYQDENEITSWVSANCGSEDLLALEVQSYPFPEPGGVALAHACG